jgi:hypothetical protein
MLLVCACAMVEPARAKPVELKAREKGAGISQAELQQDLERFSGEFADRLNDAMAPLMSSPNAQIRDTALRQQLGYFASALDIATESQPELGVLDMIVFVTLAHDTAREYWVPQVWGEAGNATERSLARSEEEIWKTGAKVLSPQNRETLARLIRDWRAQNPNQRSIEAVRFSDFSRLEENNPASANTASGLLATVRSAAQAADQAVLLGERAIFMTHRLPFVLRLQARLGAQEIISDTATDLASLPATLDRLEQLRPMIQDAASMAKQSTAAAEETRRLVEQLRPLLKESGLNDPSGAGLPHQLERANDLADKSLALATELRSLAPKGDRDVARQLDAWARRWLLYLFGVGVILIALFWVGYYVARRLVDAHARAPTRGHRGVSGAQLHPR